MNQLSLKQITTGLYSSPGLVFSHSFLARLLSVGPQSLLYTNRRIIIKTGFIARNTFEMNLSKIESVNVDQSFMGRILGYGSMTIIGTGGTREAFQ